MINKVWLKAAGIRALKTFAQTAVATISIGVALNEVDWLRVLSVAAVAAVCSLLTSAAGLPEVSEGVDR
jgi:hypothetical protein